MRQKDFGDSVSVVALSNQFVSVSSTTLPEARELVRVELKNKEHLSPWVSQPNDLGPTAYVFTVRYQEEIVGQVILYNFDRETSKCTISYWIDQSHCNKGIGTTAVKLVTDYAREQLEILTVEAAIRENNLASIRLVEKLGFIKVGRKPKYLFVDGQMRDHLIYYLQ